MRVLRRFLAGGGLAVVTIAALATPTFAATRPLTLDISIGSGCFDGGAKPNTTIKWVVRDSSGAPKGRNALLTESDGTWFDCLFSFDGLGAGDRIKVIDYDTNQTLNYTVPRMTLSVNRVTDMVSGKAPAGLHMSLEAYDSSGPIFGHDPYDETVHVTANGAGAYSHDFGADGIDLMAGAQLSLTTSAAGGAIVTHRDLAVPGVFILENEAVFGGYMPPYQHLGIKLKVGGAQVATGDAVADDSDQFQSKFIDADGEPYKVAGGEKLTAPALGISWTVPVINGTVNKSTDVVSGTCFANSAYVVEVGFFGFAYGPTGGDGTFSVDMSDQTNIRAGDEVLIACATHAGDFVEQDFIVP